LRVWNQQIFRLGSVDCIAKAPASDRFVFMIATALRKLPGQASATPSKIVVDPEMRMKLRRALIDLIDYHDEALAENFSGGRLSLESYKEYIELFARSLKETMESREGVAYLLRSAGFDMRPDEINLSPELRWKRAPGPFGSSLI